MFDLAFSVTDSKEAGYANHPNDKGGETYGGISRVFHPNLALWHRIDAAKAQLGIVNLDTSLRENRELLQELNAILAKDKELYNMRKAFFRKCFYDVHNCDKIKNIDIVVELYDTSVLCGTKIAAKFLQRAMNVINNNGKRWDNIKVDGNVGNITIKTLNKAISKGYAQEIFKVQNILQGNHVVNIAEKRPSQQINLIGWLLRVEFDVNKR